MPIADIKHKLVQTTPRVSRIMLADHLAREAILQRYRQTTRATERTHWHIIYLKSQGRVVQEIADIMGYSAAWVRRLIRRYNEVGPDAFIVRQASGVPAEAEHLVADHARKSEELFEARLVQQSMLTSPVPDHPDLDIAVFMQTASELSGDYYDFHLCDDGTLTTAVGDATGHGAKAGVMVTATKTLFKALGHESDMLVLVRRLTQTLKNLNLRGLYMHLTICRYSDSRLHFVVAGMPPVLVYRAATGQVHDLVLKGMPLGSFPEFPYKQCTIEFAPGDTVLLMSDGFVELLDRDGTMLEPRRVLAIFKEVAHKNAADIIAHLRSAGTAWQNTRPLNDDVTFVVLKHKGRPQRPSTKKPAASTVLSGGS